MSEGLLWCEPVRTCSRLYRCHLGGSTASTPGRQTFWPQCQMNGGNRSPISVSCPEALLSVPETTATQSHITGREGGRLTVACPLVRRLKYLVELQRGVQHRPLETLVKTAGVQGIHVPAGTQTSLSSAGGSVPVETPGDTRQPFQCHKTHQKQSSVLTSFFKM